MPKKEIRRAKGGQEIALADKMKENPKILFNVLTYKGKRVTRGRIVPLRNQSDHRCVELQ